MKRNKKITGKSEAGQSRRTEKWLLISQLSSLIILIEIQLMVVQVLLTCLEVSKLARRGFQ